MGTLTELGLQASPIRLPPVKDRNRDVPRRSQDSIPIRFSFGVDPRIGIRHNTQASDGEAALEGLGFLPDDGQVETLRERQGLQFVKWRIG